MNIRLGIVFVLALASAAAAALDISGAPPGRAWAQAQVAAGGPVVAPKAVTLNPTSRKLALAQGDWKPEAWTLHAYSGQTGGNEAYGWTFAHLLSPEWVRLVIQCYAARPAFYEHAPFRRAGYLDGSRPVVWSPEGAFDLPSGEWESPYGTRVSGPDLEHFPMGPLFAVADSTGYIVATPSGPKPAHLVAREILRGLLRAHAGMLRNEWGVTSYVAGGRPNRWILDNLVNGAQRGLLEPSDVATMHLYFLQTMLPAQESVPNTRVYNGLCYELPELFDAYRVCSDRALRGRIWSVVRAMAERQARLCELVPGRACQVEQVSTWDASLTAEGVKLTDYYEPWEIRSMLVSAEALGESPEADACRAEAAAAIARQKSKPEACVWLVDAEGAPLQ